MNLGISKPRVSHDGTLLPSARDVSLEVHRPHYSEDNHFTVMLAVWGQFMDHDITATAINQGLNISQYINVYFGKYSYGNCGKSRKIDPNKKNPSGRLAF